jgi:multidrug efflux pump subunit AcrA (membrane-fusion protein)
LRLLKLANWLSEGDLDKYKQQAKQAQQDQAKLTTMESELEKLRNTYQETQKQLAQAKAQLQINQGFQIELGETQLQLKKIEAEATRYKKELFEQTKELNSTRSQLKQVQQTLAISQNWTEQIKTPIQVTDISKTLPKQNFDTLWGFGITTPEVNSTTITGAILVKGWVLGKKAQAQTLRVIYQTELLLETPVQDSRPIVMERYPDIPTAKNSGFEFALAVAGISTETQLHLEVALADETIVPLCALTMNYPNLLR